MLGAHRKDRKWPPGDVLEGPVRGAPGDVLGVILCLVVPGARRSGTVVAWKLDLRHGIRLLAAA